MSDQEYQEVLKQYLDDPLVTGRSQKHPWDDISNADQVNVQILSVDEESSIFTRVIPRWKTMTVGVRAKDEDGEPIKQDGKFLYDEKELPVLTKIETTDIRLPFKFFTNDIPKSNLNVKDRKMLMRSFQVAYKLMQKQIMEPNKDYSGTLLYIHGLVNSIAISSRGLNAGGLQWAKTSASYSGTISETIEQQKLRDMILQNPNLDAETKKKVSSALFDEKRLNKIMDWGAGYQSKLDEEGRSIQRGTSGWQNAWGKS